MKQNYNPFKPALWVCLALSLSAGVFHYFAVVPNNWSGFLMWLPVVWIIPMGLASISYYSEKKEIEG